MSAITKYDALIIDPNLDTRMRLKTATTSVHQFGKVQLAGSLREGEGFMNGDQEWNVVFISFTIPRDEISAFIKDSKEKPQGQDAAYILVLKTNDQDSSTVAQNMMIGADGQLFEPYSVDYLLEITELAARIKKERSSAREKAALKFLIHDVIEQINLMAYLKSAGYDVGRGIKRFKNMCSVFHTLEGDSLENYFELAVDMFEESPFPKKIYQKSYSGASSRVKKRMEQKMLAKLEGEMAGEEDSKPVEEAKQPSA
ncbi:MAG: hypothetical protein D6719_05015 [Candidatus Dadabacteria bacterium]|nr:MAG: hypothetical protein D6719_05015 [Candidatus Dadabacteria bacterium]